MYTFTGTLLGRERECVAIESFGESRLTNGFPFFPFSTQHQLEKSGDLLAVVANCGDSRLLTDDGSGFRNFRTVTRDHRVEDVTERERLDRYMKTHGQAAHFVQHRDTLRLYPGGLAVSRTIGDVGFTAAAVPTPDVFRIPLWSEAQESTESTSESREKRVVRFVLATDGIWDILSNTEVGKLVARDGRDGVRSSPTEATRALMNECLRRTGGHHGEFPFLFNQVSYLRLTSAHPSILESDRRYHSSCGGHSPMK